MYKNIWYLMHFHVIQIIFNLHIREQLYCNNGHQKIVTSTDFVKIKATYFSKTPCLNWKPSHEIQ